MLPKTWSCLLLSILASASWSNGTYAISRGMPLHLLTHQSDVIIVGTVVDADLLAETTVQREPGEGHVMRVSSRQMGIVFEVLVTEPLYLSGVLRKAWKTDEKPRIRVLMTLPCTETGPVYLMNKQHLLFLRETKPDQALFEKGKLQEGVYYESVDGKHSTLRLDKETETPVIRRHVERNLKYLEVTKAFCKVMNLQDKTERTTRLQELLESPIPELRESAKWELKRQENPEDYRQYFRGYRNARWESREQE